MLVIPVSGWKQAGSVSRDMCAGMDNIESALRPE